MATGQAQHRLFERVHKNESAPRNHGAPEASGASPADSVTERGVVIGDWTITVLHGSIGNANEMDALSDLLGIPPPEMYFPRNALILHHKPSGFEYCFDATRALQCVEGVRSENALSPIECAIDINALDAGSRRKTHRRSSSANIKVSYADEWGKSRDLSRVLEHGKPAPDAGGNAGTNSISSTKQFDWTYSSTWPGAAGSGACAQEANSDDGFCAGSDPARDRIPTERLGPGGEPILFYDEVMLYEDELGDNGSSMLNVKVRVMPSSFLVLQRFFLRVDNVVFRVFDTRLFCSFQSADGDALTNEERRAWSANDALAGRPAPASWPRVIRECRGTEVPYDEVNRRLPPHKPDDLSQLTSVNWVAETMRTLQMHKLRQQLGAGGTAAMAPTPAAAPGGPSGKILGELPADSPKDTWEGDGQCVDVATLRYGVST